MIRYAVFGSDDSPDALIEQLESGLDEVQRRTSLLFAYSYSEQQPQSEIHIWRAHGGEDALIRLVDDWGVPARYLVVEAARPEASAAILDALADTMEFASLPELQDQARVAGREQASALVRLALAAGEPVDPSSAELIERGLRSPDADLREAGVLAAALTRSPQFLADLERLYAQETDPTARDVLAQAIADCGGQP